MTESQLLDFDNDTLTREYSFYRSVSSKSNQPESREAFIQDLTNLYDKADKNHNNKIEREEFTSLIRGYFELKSIRPTKENYDQYFDRLDSNHDLSISLDEFVSFMDEVVESDILPFITEEMQNRGLL
eukprot:403350481